MQNRKKHVREFMSSWRARIYIWNSFLTILMSTKSPRFGWLIAIFKKFDDYIAVNKNDYFVEVFTNQDLLKQKNWNKVSYIDDFIAIKRTINRPENRDKIVHFHGILMTWDISAWRNDINNQKEWKIKTFIFFFVKHGCLTVLFLLLLYILYTEQIKRTILNIQRRKKNKSVHVRNERGYTY
jgi:hypothetical protein